MPEKMTDADVRELKMIVTARIERLRKMYETVGPNHGDIKLLIEKEIPLLLTALAQIQNRVMMARDAFSALARGELSELAALTVVGMLFSPHEYTDEEKRKIGEWARRLEILGLTGGGEG